MRRRTALGSALSAAFGVLSLPANADPAAEFATALIAAERSPEIRPEEDIYAGLLGVWGVEVRDRLDDGSFRVSHGEWHFARTLEGRAVQDVWIVPARSARTPQTDRLGNRYGSSMRTLDPASRRWQVTWFNPVSGAFDVLYTRVEGGQIVQEGRRADGVQLRWTFVEITSTSFHWLGEELQVDGSWLLGAEFFGRRQSTAEIDLGAVPQPSTDRDRRQ